MVRRVSHGISLATFSAELLLLVGFSALPARAEPSAWSARPLSVAEQRRMTPSVWRPGCPVDLSDIRRVTVEHWTYTGKSTSGRIDVHHDVADAVVAVFRELYEAKFPINKMVPIEAYRGSDDRSIDDDNTSAFNCRPITGGKKFSQHSYGTAIDLNPYRNPYVNNGKVRARPGIGIYVSRDPTVAKTGVIYAGGPVVSAFVKHGFKWGGYWDNPKDYQHFSTSGG